VSGAPAPGPPTPGPPTPGRSARRGTRVRILGVLVAVVLFALITIGLGLGPRLVAPEGRPAALPPDPASWQERPFRADSPWNMPIGAQPATDPNSDELIAQIDRPLTSDPTQFTFTVYIVDSRTPVYDVPCTKYPCTQVTPSGTTVSDVLSKVPIPTDAKPSSGTDGQMILVNPGTGLEYDLWQAERTQVGWEVSNASVYNIRGDGTPIDYGSRGAGIPYLAGLVRPWEITNGKVEHAVAFATDRIARDRCVWPASKTDGKSGRKFAPPEGARLQLDPGLSERDFDSLGLDATARVIARALQQYGMILVDGSGRTKVYAENLVDNPYASAKWDANGLTLNESSLSPIPLERFRVLALPPGYWTGSGPKHGDCYRP
jgi:hypothetical protein